MSRKVTFEEEEKLMQFFNSHSVKYYDLCLILMSTLKTKIEALWIENPTFSFEQALDKVYLSYGKTGFRNFINSNEVKAERNYWQGFLSFLKAFYLSSKIGLIVILLFICGYFYTYFEKSNVYIPTLFSYTFLIIAFSSSLMVIIYYLVIKRNAIKPLMALNVYFDFFIIFILDLLVLNKAVNWMMEGFKINKAISPSNYIVSCILCIVLIAINIAKINYFKHIFSKAKIQYPLAFKIE